jgi:dihydroorotate dehydrogenase
VTGWAAATALLRALPPERAHRLTVRALALGLGPRAAPDPPALQTRLWDLDFANPVGIAAGFDKDAEAFAALLRLGAGLVEVGTVTPRPQPGNPRPRVFRLPEDAAVINRLGFNSAGVEAAVRRLEARNRGLGVVGVNIGVNRDSDDAQADFVSAFRRLGPLADYVAVNVSSPNTPGLRELQQPAALDSLVAVLQAARDDMAAAGARRVPLLVKIAPDLDPGELARVAEVARARALDGLIVANTTVARPEGLCGPARAEAGGLSGRPLFAPSTRMLAEVRRLTEGRVPLIGVGGIASGADAYAKIRAGASLVQLYTALIFQGPGLIARIKHELAELLAADGFAHVAGAVGTGAAP